MENERVDDGRAIELRAQWNVMTQNIARLTDQQRLLETLASEHAVMLQT